MESLCEERRKLSLLLQFALLQVFLLLAVLFLRDVSCQQLGAGTGVGSCRAFPYRVKEVDWEVCPAETSCCNEYGFCRTRVGCQVDGENDCNENHVLQEEWNNQQFRDCNGVSNGIDLPDAVLQIENSLGGVAGEALGAERTFDITKVGGGVYGPGGSGGAGKFDEVVWQLNPKVNPYSVGHYGYLVDLDH